MSETLFKWAFLLSIVTVLGLPTAFYISTKHDMKRIKESMKAHPTNRKSDNDN
jgi:hypothetical protein